MKVPRSSALAAARAAIVATVIAGCTAGAPTSSPWTIYTPGPTLTPSPLPTPTATPAPSPSPSPVAIDTTPPPDCPSALPAQPMRIHIALAIDPLCFGTATISLIGWQAGPNEFDYEGPDIEPGWLIYPQDQAKTALWDAKPDRYGGCVGDGCAWTFVHVLPGSALTFNETGQWVKVTGHLNDPAAATCHYVYPPAPSQSEFLPDSDARHACAGSFILESVEVTTAPS